MYTETSKKQDRAIALLEKELESCVTKNQICT